MPRLISFLLVQAGLGLLAGAAFAGGLTALGYVPLDEFAARHGLWAALAGSFGLVGPVAMGFVATALELEAAPPL